MPTVGTTGKFWEIRIFNHKAASRRRINKVDFRAVKMRIKFLLRRQYDAIEIIFRIDGGIEFSIKVEGVLHSAAPSAENTDPQKRIAPKTLRCLDPLDFVDRCCCY